MRGGRLAQMIDHHLSSISCNQGSGWQEVINHLGNHPSPGARVGVDFTYNLHNSETEHRIIPKLKIPLFFIFFSGPLQLWIPQILQWKNLCVVLAIALIFLPSLQMNLNSNMISFELVIRNGVFWRYISFNCCSISRVWWRNNETRSKTGHW